MPELHVLPTPEEAPRAAAGFVTGLAGEHGTATGRFTINLCPGHHPLVRDQGCCRIAEDGLMCRN